MEGQLFARELENAGHVFLVDVRLDAENRQVVFRDRLLAVVDDVAFPNVERRRAGQVDDVRVDERDRAGGLQPGSTAH